MKIKKILCSVLVIMLSVLILPMQPTAFADPYIPEEMLIINEEGLISQNIYLDGISDVADVTNLKSSNKKVATVKKFAYENAVHISITPKKTGKTTVTFNYKYNGKVKKAKVKVTIVKYENPFKSIKVGSKNYALQFKKQSSIAVNKELKGKLTIKLKNGWKLLQVYSCKSSNGDKYKVLAANKKITIKKGYMLGIMVQDTAGNSREFCIYVNN